VAGNLTRTLDCEVGVNLVNDGPKASEQGMDCPLLPLPSEVHHTVLVRLALDQNTLDKVKGRCSHVSLF